MENLVKCFKINDDPVELKELRRVETVKIVNAMDYVRKNTIVFFEENNLVVYDSEADKKTTTNLVNVNRVKAINNNCLALNTHNGFAMVDLRCPSKLNCHIKMPLCLNGLEAASEESIWIGGYDAFKKKGIIGVIDPRFGQTMWLNNLNHPKMVSEISSIDGYIVSGDASGRINLWLN